MGYTHFWMRPNELDREQFAAAARDCRAVCEESGVKLQGIEGREDPIFERFIVAFNGGCEAFVVQCICGPDSPERPRRDGSGAHWGFCKTEQSPYDICVEACLIVFNHHFGIDFTVSSDADSSEWIAARELCQRALGYGKSFSLADWG